MGCNLTGSTMHPFSFVNGKLVCEKVEIDKLFDSIKANPDTIDILGKKVTYNVPCTPAYVYSHAGIQKNVHSYVEALKDANLTGKIGYAIKANANIHLVEKMRSFGVGMIIAVSGYEVLAGIKAGFEPENILLNGNGKQAWEVKMAIELGVMMNVDSIFDARQITKIHEDICSENEVKVLLRIRPAKPSDAESKLKIHEYVNTAENSKFGFEFSELDQVIDILMSRQSIKIVGVHCHFGSCIDDTKVYQWLGKTISEITEQLRQKGVEVNILNVGGGIGINYHENPPGFDQYISVQNMISNYNDVANRPKGATEVPRISSFITALSKMIPPNVQVIVEPGRFLIGKAGILVCKVLGQKVTDDRRYLVVDGSMNEVMRPCLYGSHHQIVPTTIQTTEKWEAYDVVGPICESADFLGKNVPIQSPPNYVAVLDCGAYCNSMSSNYNMRPRVPEILVNGDSWNYIKRRDTFHDLINSYAAN